eukprot:gene1101-1654_t
MQVVQRLDATAFPDVEASGAASHARGVYASFLVDFTRKHGCARWPTWRVVRDIIKPATADTCCRFVELPDMAGSGVVGPAEVFASHCWGSPWGDLVAAVTFKAHPSRRVWCDVFAVRQWPGNGADLDFSLVIKRCKGLILAFTNPPENFLNLMEGRVTEDCGEDDGEYLDRERKQARLLAMPLETRSKLPFLRIWCVAELFAAVQADVAVVVMAGVHKRPCGVLDHTHDSVHDFGFEYIDLYVLDAIEQTLDVSKAESAVEADRVRILAELEAACGSNVVNEVVRDAIGASYKIHGSPELAALAFGERYALEQPGFDPNRILADSNLSLLSLAASAGYVSAIRLLLDAGADPNQRDADFREFTPALHAELRGYKKVADLLYLHMDPTVALFAAAQGGRTKHVKGMLQAGADVHIVGAHNPLWAAVGQPEDDLPMPVESVILILGAGADPNGLGTWDEMPLTRAARQGREEICKVLVEAGANVALKDEWGDTAADHADKKGYTQLAHWLKQKQDNEASVR